MDSFTVRLVTDSIVDLQRRFVPIIPFNFLRVDTRFEFFDVAKLQIAYFNLAYYLQALFLLVVLRGFIKARTLTMRYQLYLFYHHSFLIYIFQGCSQNSFLFGTYAGQSGSNFLAFHALFTLFILCFRLSFATKLLC